MTEEMTITKARAQLMGIPKRLSRSKRPKTLAITQHGKPVLAVMPWEFYEGLVETLEIMSDPDLMKSIRKGIEELDAGKGIPWEEAKKRLGL